MSDEDKAYEDNKAAGEGAPAADPAPAPAGRVPRTGDAVQPLIDRERIRGASRMIPEGTEAVTPDQVREVVDAVNLHIRSYSIPVQQVARACSLGHSTVSEFLNGKYRGNVGKVALYLERWVTEDEARRRRPETTQFVWTNVALLIKGTAEYCRDEGNVGLVYSPDSSGMGKTMALRAIHQALGPDASGLLTIDKVDASPTGLLRRICKAVGVDDGHGSNHQRKERIVERLRGRDYILLIDQVHNLRGAKDDKPLYILADLHDALKELHPDKIGGAQLWCGTADMAAYLDQGRRRKHDESLTQIRTRVCPQVDLVDALVGSGGGGEPLFTIDQVTEMFAKNRLRLTSGALRWLCQVANLPDYGSLRLCVELVKYPTKMVELRSGAKSIDVSDLLIALRASVQPRLRDGLTLRLKSESPAPRIAAAG